MWEFFQSPPKSTKLIPYSMNIHQMWRMAGSTHMSSMRDVYFRQNWIVMSGQFCTLAVFYAMEVFFTFNIIWYYAVEEKRKDAFYRSSSDVVVITIKAWSVKLWLGNQLSITYSYDELNFVVWLLLCPVFEMELLFK